MENSKLEKLWGGDLWLPCLKKMNLKGSKDLKEIPDLSRATNLEELFLKGCSSLVELPSSIRHLNKLVVLHMSECTNLEILPSGINLQSLDILYLRSCYKLKSFPDISRNVKHLCLDRTAIEEIPWWIDNFYKLDFLSMKGCSKLKYASITPTPKLSLIFDLSNCEALVGVGWNGYPNGVAKKAELINMELPVLEEGPNVLLHSCYNLDVEALLQQQSVFRQLNLTGEKMPLYFTYRAKEAYSSLTIPLLQTSLPYPFIRLRLCAVVFSDDSTYLYEIAEIKLNCRFKDRVGNHFDYIHNQMSFTHFEPVGNLLVFDIDLCPPEKDIAKLNFDHVNLLFTGSFGKRPSWYLREWGIRLLEDNSSAENQLGDPSR